MFITHAYNRRTEESAPIIFFYIYRKEPRKRCLPLYFYCTATNKCFNLKLTSTRLKAQTASAATVYFYWPTKHFFFSFLWLASANTWNVTSGGHQVGCILQSLSEFTSFIFLLLPLQSFLLFLSFYLVFYPSAFFFLL